MIEPRMTAVSGRRYLALLIDSALVTAAGLAVAFMRSDSFAVIGRDDAGNPLVDPSEFDRMEELLTFDVFGRSEILGINLVRAQEIGDSVRIFGADSYQWGLVAAALASLVVFYTIPAATQRTIGMLPFGLEIRGIDGQRASVGAHLKRSLVGVIDMIPGVVPGLLGLAVASFSTHQQRLGDRVAATVVVDRRLASFYFSDRQEAAPTISVGEVSGSDSADTADATPTTDPAEPEDTPLPPPPIHRKPPSERPKPVEDVQTPEEPGAWEPPRAEPAPVWKPTPFDPAPVEAPRADDTRTLDEIIVGQPTVGELIDVDPVATERHPGPGDGASTVAGRATASTKAPVWSDKWRAWMYWDPKNKRWLRHDTATNTWIPAD